MINQIMKIDELLRQYAIGEKILVVYTYTKHICQKLT
jgi:hypothetical protein